MGKYFGTDGVRGVANSELTPELAFKLGRFGGYVLRQHAKDIAHPLVLVARDTRISGQLLEYALVSGLLSVGIEVLQLGVIPTPGVAYLTRIQGAVAGVTILHRTIQQATTASNSSELTVLNCRTNRNTKSKPIWIKKGTICRDLPQTDWVRWMNILKAS